MSRANWVDDGQLTLDRPTRLLWQFDHPVLETKKNNHESVLHWPDLASDPDDPTPACGGPGFGNADAVDYVIKELTGGLAAFRRPCPKDECRHRLQEMADELEVEFNG